MMQLHQVQAAAPPMTVVLLALISTSCVMGSTVEVSNSMDTPVVIEMSQYHAIGFDGTRPPEFTPELLGNTTSVRVEPGEEIEVDFNDAGGGYWLVWRQVEPVVDCPPSGILHLVPGEENKIILARVIRE